MYENADINIEIEKKWFPDATITGHTTKDSIDTYINLWLSHVEFTAEKKDGMINGKVDKSEFDWNVTQKNDNTYEIQRTLLKWDGNLKIDVNDGKIFGVYERGGFAWDWDINGTYDKDGNLKIEIDAPWTLDINLAGKITQK
jgi:hypothetical protein